MSVQIKNFLKVRHDRALGTILGYAEREIYDRLEATERRDFRRAVIDALNSYHEAALDILRSEDGLTNDEVVAVLERLERHMRT